MSKHHLITRRRTLQLGLGTLAGMGVLAKGCAEKQVRPIQGARALDPLERNFSSEIIVGLNCP